MLKNTLIIFSINLFCLVFLEFILGFFIFQKNIRNFSDTERVVSPYRKKELAWLNSNEFSVPYYINNIGVRDLKDHEVKFGDYDILFMGDSFAEGWGTEYKNSYFKILESRLGKKCLIFHKTEVAPYYIFIGLNFSFRKTTLKG